MSGKKGEKEGTTRAEKGKGEEDKEKEGKKRAVDQSTLGPKMA